MRPQTGERTNRNKEKIMRKHRGKNAGELQKVERSFYKKGVGLEKDTSIGDKGVAVTTADLAAWGTLWSPSVCPCFDQIPGFRLQSQASVVTKVKAKHISYPVIRSPTFNPFNI